VETQKSRLAFLQSLPLLWLSLALLLGVVPAFVLSFPALAWLALAGSSFAGWLLLRGKRTFLGSFAALALCALFLGAARFQSAQRQITPDSLAHYNGNDVWLEITGLLVEPALDRDSYLELRVRAEQLQLPDSGEFPIKGMILARTSIDKNWQYGDRLILRGRLETPPEFEDFSYRAYLARQGIDSLLSFAQVVRLESGRAIPFLLPSMAFVPTH